MNHYNTFEAGPWNQLQNHCFKLGQLERPGKLFLSELIDSTGCEISLNRIEAGDDYPFLHKHRKHEEIYIVVSGRGDFLVDGELIPVREGCVIRIAPEGVRSVRAAHDEPLTYLCIQATVDTLSSRLIHDGELVPGEVRWNEATLFSNS